MSAKDLSTIVSESVRFLRVCSVVSPWKSSFSTWFAVAGSSPVARGLPDTPSILTWVAWSVETVCTPGTLRTTSAAAVGMGSNPFVFWTSSSPWKLLSIASAIDALRPAAKMVTNETRASPIIRAAAVAAVRDGFRWEFSRASRPVSPRSLSSGAPMTAASGGTRRGL